MGLNAEDLHRLSPEAREKILKQLGLQQKSKYKNEPVYRGKIRFASKKEARRYDELMLLLRAGKIEKLKLQPQFVLQEAYTTPEGERIRAITYLADFSYERGGKLVVEDVKSRGTATDKYRIKRKLLQERYGITVVEV